MKDNSYKKLGFLLFFLAAPLFAGSKQIVAKHSGLCLDVQSNSYYDGANLQQFRCHYGVNQKFEFVLDGEDSYGNPLYRIVVEGSDKCVDVRGGSTYDLANVQQFRCHGGENQLFRLVKVEKYYKKYFQIVNQKSGKCLNIHHASKYNHGNLIQYRCVGADNELFTIN